MFSTDQSLKSQYKTIFTETVMSNAGYAIDRIFKKNSIVIKAMWSLSLLVFSAIASYLCVSNVMGYYDREIVSKITVLHETPLEFPTITFCNLSPFQTNFSLELLHEIVINTVFWISRPTGDPTRYCLQTGEKLVDSTLNEIFVFV